ncbi:MAG: PAS domain-containing protein [Chloroflexi bacterium]|nr:PAS domain-containing protein [Chloroflexota bacterium]
MFFFPDDLWIIRIVALVVYVGLLLFLLSRRRWQDALDQRLWLYIGLALVSNLAFVGSLGNWIVPVRELFSRLHIYAQAALPLFFYAIVPSFIRSERRLRYLIPGIVFIGGIIIVDLFQIWINVGGLIGPATLIFVARVAIWLFYTGLTMFIGIQAYLQTLGALHRNRLAYPALASAFLFLDGGLDLLLPDPYRHIEAALQIGGILLLSYAVLRHDLVDLRALLRRTIYVAIVGTFTILIYFSAFEAAIALLQGSDPTGNLVGAIVAALILAFVYQPLHNWLDRVIQTFLFGNRYDVQQIVSQFNRRLSTRINLDEFVDEGRTLLQGVVGARDVRLLIVEQNSNVYTFYPLPARSGSPENFRLDATSSLVDALATRGGPVLQYDIDRLPIYNDLTADTRAALQSLNGEVYLPVTRGSLIGVWVVGVKVSTERYTDEELTLLKLLASQSAVALENARLLSDLRAQMSEVRSMRDYLDSTMASIATGVLTLNRAGEIVSFNRAAEGIFRVPTIMAIGKRYDQVLPALEGAQMDLLLARLWTQSAQHLVRDAVGRVAERGEVHLTLHLSAIRRADDMVGVAIVVEDLTEQARLERQRRVEEREKQRVRNTFERYVAPTVVEGLLAFPDRVALGGERHLITAMFADLHGFTSLSEQLPPEELVKVLNGYLSLAAQTILRYEGTLDKFLGDGVMALFNAPLSQADHALRAALAALALQGEVNQFAKELPKTHRLTFRIGLHTGDAVVGNIGTNDLMNYTAVGDTVNIAKRLQENAENGQILISRQTFDWIADQVCVQPKEMLTVKGRITPVEVFVLTSLRDMESDGKLM